MLRTGFFAGGPRLFGDAHGQLQHKKEIIKILTGLQDFQDERFIRFYPVILSHVQIV
jgi:hypothetical protein